MVNFNSLKDINEIQNAQERVLEVFTKEEKLIFATDSEIAGDIIKARQLAELLVKVKQAKRTFKENTALHKQLEDAKDEDTLAYRILQSYNEMVSDALAHLERYYGDEGTTGKTEEQIKQQISVKYWLKIRTLKNSG